jgi:hypothetical protein
VVTDASVGDTTQHPCFSSAYGTNNGEICLYVIVVRIVLVAEPWHVFLKDFNRKKVDCVPRAICNGIEGKQ